MQEVEKFSYEEYSDHESVTVHLAHDSMTCLVWKRDAGKEKYKTFDTDSTKILLLLLSEMIKRLANDISPNEETAIRKMGDWVIEVISQRVRTAEETKTRRNKLIRVLRLELERLKK